MLVASGSYTLPLGLPRLQEGTLPSLWGVNRGQAYHAGLQGSPNPALGGERAGMTSRATSKSS